MAKKTGASAENSYELWKKDGARNPTLLSYLGDEETVVVPRCGRLDDNCFAGKHVRELHFTAMDSIRFWENKPMPGLEDVRKIVCHYNSPAGSFMPLNAFLIRMPGIEEIEVVSEKENQLILWRGIPQMQKTVYIRDPNCIRLTIYGADDEGLHTDKLRLIMPRLNPAKADNPAGRAAVLYSFLEERKAYAAAEETYMKSMKRNVPGWLPAFMELNFPESVCDALFRAVQPLKKDQYDKLLEAAEQTKNTYMAARIVEEREKHVDREAEERREERRLNYDLDHPFSARNMRQDWDWKILPDKTAVLTVCKMEETETIAVPPEVAGKTVTGLGDELFRGRKELKTVELPDTIRTIGAACFAQTGLVSFEAPADLTYIGDSALCYCAMKSFTVPERMHCVPDGLLAFSQVENVVIHDGVEEIRDFAFAGCENLRHIHLPSGLETVGEGAFQKSGLEEIRLPGSIKHIHIQAFKDCENLKHVDLSDFNDGSEGSGENSASFHEIPAQCFFQCTGLQKIELPRCIRKIGNAAFAKSALEEIVLNEGLEKMDVQAFSDCNNLRRIVLPLSMRRIGDQAFRSSGLQEICLNEGLEIIDGSAFADCEKLEHVVISGDGLKESRENQLPESLKGTGAGLFKGCSSLTSFRWPKALRFIPQRCFSQSALETICIPETVESIGNGAFSKCRALSAAGTDPVPGSGLLEISSQVRRIVSDAFRTCNSIRHLVFRERDADSELQLGIGAFLSSGLTEVVIPAFVREIPDGLFDNCSDLKNCVLPEGITTIGKRAFKSTALHEMILPSTVTCIGTEAFKDCRELVHLKLPEGMIKQGFTVNGTTIVSPFKKKPKKKSPQNGFQLHGN